MGKAMPHDVATPSTPVFSFADAENRAGSRFGDFELLARIGDGGMGAVYVARPVTRSVIERLYALKIPHAYMIEAVEGCAMMLLDEARIASVIRHPNVIPVLGAPKDERGDMALLMDYVEGASFDCVMRRARDMDRPLPRPVVLRMLLDGLAGLSAAHRQETIDGRPMQVVHRDVAPNNLFVGIDGHTRLTDFGIAAAVERYAHSQVGSIKGRMAYMAPERISGGVADARADVFSYGVVLWEMLAKKRLFRASNDYNTARRVLELDVPKLAGLDPELACFDGVIGLAMARRPNDRYQTADALLEAVEDVALATTGIATARAVERVIAPLLRTRIEVQRAAIRAAASRFEGGSGGAVTHDDASLDEPTIVEWRSAPTMLATL
jgi:eukaryotic-like serine/threonine-protein kinase